MDNQHLAGIKHKGRFIITCHYPQFEEKLNLYKRLWFMANAVGKIPKKLTYEELEGLSHCYAEMQSKGVEYEDSTINQLNDIFDSKTDL